MQRFALALVLFGLAFVTSEYICPDNVRALDQWYFFIINNDCFYFSLESRMEYADATDFCKTYGGTLAMPKNESLNDAMVRTMVHRYSTYKNLWIGLDDINEEGKYMWQDGTEVEWDAFADSTGGLGGGSEDCISLNIVDAKWHDSECVDGQNIWDLTDAKNSFVCQFPGVEAPPADGTTAFPGVEAPPADGTTA